MPACGAVGGQAFVLLVWKCVLSSGDPGERVIDRVLAARRFRRAFLSLVREDGFLSIYRFLRAHGAVVLNTQFDIVHATDVKVSFLLLYMCVRSGEYR
ncbi:hypothetical protein B0G84_8685 [Paraburkholderia sp. BL8N3]|nr:hypothetical protein B0G84_8685 [Paraburkholderia sp. BL8N3]